MKQIVTHTAGPWKSGFTEKKTDEVFQISTGKRLAQCARTGHSNLETTANARLIAAAPDLLEALELCRCRLGKAVSMARTSHKSDDFSRAEEALAKADAALAKATARAA